jgi:hypothetical protein
MENHIMTSHQGTTASAEHAIGMKDKTYNLVSVLYHALQGGETSMQYIQDAEHEGDQELVQFFHEVQDCQRHLASRAKDMLRQRLGQNNGEEWNRQQTVGTHQHGTKGKGGQPRH